MASSKPAAGLPPDPTDRRGEPPPVPRLEPQPGDDGPEAADAPLGAGLDLVLDVKVGLSVELGRAKIPIRDVVNIARGSIIELDGTPGAPLEVRVNGVLVGRGEIVVIDEERLGLRFTEVVGPAQRVGHLR